MPEGFPRPGGGVFRQTYRAFSVLLLPGAERQDVERGGKSIGRQRDVTWFHC